MKIPEEVAGVIRQLKNIPEVLPEDLPEDISVRGVIHMNRYERVVEPSHALLHTAVCRNDLEMVKCMHSLGARLNIRLAKYACWKGCEEVFDYIVERFNMTQIRTDDNYLLKCAIERSQIGIIRILRRKGLRVEDLFSLCRGGISYKRSMIELSIEKENLEILKELICWGVDTYSTIMSPAYETAIEAGSLDIVKYLQSVGVRVKNTHLIAASEVSEEIFLHLLKDYNVGNFHYGDIREILKHCCKTESVESLRQFMKMTYPYNFHHPTDLEIKATKKGLEILKILDRFLHPVYMLRVVKAPLGQALLEGWNFEFVKYAFRFVKIEDIRANNFILFATKSLKMFRYVYEFEYPGGNRLSDRELLGLEYTFDTPIHHAVKHQNLDVVKYIFAQTGFLLKPPHAFWVMEYASEDLPIFKYLCQVLWEPEDIILEKIKNPEALKYAKELLEI